MAKCPIHGDDCPGDDGGFFIDGNHPDDMFSVQPEDQEEDRSFERDMSNKYPVESEES